MNDDIQEQYGKQPWHELWLFGIILDDDRMERLTGYWNPEGSLRVRSDYYVPDDYDSEVALLPLDFS